MIPPESGDFVSRENLYNYVAKVMRDLADRESCVIIGRCGDYILRDRSNVLRLYVHAPFDYCVRKAMEVHGSFSADEAARYIRKVDKRRGGILSGLHPAGAGRMRITTTSASTAATWGGQMRGPGQGLSPDQGARQPVTLSRK